MARKTKQKKTPRLTAFQKRTLMKFGYMDAQGNATKPVPIPRKPAAPVITIKEAKRIERETPGQILKTYGRSLKEIQRAYHTKRGLIGWKTLAKKYWSAYKVNIKPEYVNLIPVLIDAQREVINWSNEDWENYNGDKTYSDKEKFLAIFAALLDISFQELTGRNPEKQDNLNEDVEPDGY